MYRQPVTSGFLAMYKPRVVFLSLRFLKKPNWASGLLDSLPIDDHCPILSIAGTKLTELSLLAPSEGHSEGRRDMGEGYSTAAPLGEMPGIMISESDQDL